MKILVISNTAWSLINFRSGLIKSLIEAGHQVITIAPLDQYEDKIKSMGARFIPIKMDNKGTNPFKDFFLLKSFFTIFQIEKPDLVISYTIKPVIYASIAAKFLNIPVFNVITGLGTAFLRESFLKKLVEYLYILSQSNARRVFFLNKDDMQLFANKKLIPPDTIDYIPGEGIDLNHFNCNHPDIHYKNLNYHDKNNLRFLLIARILWDKGVGEYIEAARLVKKKYPNTEFYLLGSLSAQNISAIPKSKVDEWVSEGIVEYLGETNDVRYSIIESDCVVLPSYREGVPRTLLEAAAMSRPIITTDTVGCRDVVDHGVNGLLCRPKDSLDLAQKIFQMISLSPKDRTIMGTKGRIKVETEFDENIVIKKFHEEILLIQK